MNCKKVACPLFFKRGSILILTLWVLSFLAIFAVGLGNTVSTQLHFAAHLQDRLKMYYLAKAGIEKAIITLEDDETPLYDALNELWAGNEDFFKETSLGAGYITIKALTLYGLRDESSKININRVSLQILKSLLENIGEVEREEAADIANAIIDWRDIDILVSPGGGESAYYKGLDLSYPCKNSEFQVLEELFLVKGMTPRIYRKIAPVITIYGEGRVNINTADCFTLHALGLNNELAKRIVRFRRGKDEIEGTEDDNIFKSVSDIRNMGFLFTKDSEEINRLISLGGLTVKSDVFRINSCGILKKGGRNLERRIICVIKRFVKGNPQILYWHEN